MSALIIYLFKSAAWLTGFALVYFIFLRNERFFRLNRFFLIAGIMASMFLPFLIIHYYVEFPSSGLLTTGSPEVTGVKTTSGSVGFILDLALAGFWITGALFVVLLILKRCRPVLRVIRDSEVISSAKMKLIRTDEYGSSFSFFSYVFVNPSVSDAETREIMNHELCHIRQKHWVDLVLSEMLCIVQWFNPLSWAFARFIRQNHEYLADEEALQRCTDPAIYRATLLNQIAGAPLFILANSFNYSLNKKRFKMMKNTIRSPYRKARIFLILPVMALLLFAFARPEYRLPSGIQVNTGGIQAKVVKGNVVMENGAALEKAIIVIQGTTEGTISDAKGAFLLNNVSEKNLLIVSFIGFKSKVVKPVFNTDMVIKMVKDTLDVSGISMPSAPPPPPPPPPPLDFDKEKVLLVIDGKISTVSLKSIDPSTIGSMNVLSNEAAVKKYGEKGKNGVLEITLKKESRDQKPSDEVYQVVEQLPQFPGGGEELNKFILSNFKYPPEAMKKGISGKVYATFIVQANGKISNVSVDTPVNPLLDAEAIRLVSIMPDWIPGKQSGKPVDVLFKLPIEFKLH